MLEHSCHFYSIEITNPNQKEQGAGPALPILPVKRPPEANPAGRGQTTSPSSVEHLEDTWFCFRPRL